MFFSLLAILGETRIKIKKSSQGLSHNAVSRPCLPPSYCVAEGSALLKMLSNPYSPFIHPRSWQIKVIFLFEN